MPRSGDEVSPWLKGCRMPEQGTGFTGAGAELWDRRSQGLVGDSSQG